MSSHMYNQIDLRVLTDDATADIRICLSTSGYMDQHGLLRLFNNYITISIIYYTTLLQQLDTFTKSI